MVHTDKHIMDVTLDDLYANYHKKSCQEGCGVYCAVSASLLVEKPVRVLGKEILARTKRVPSMFRTLLAGSAPRLRLIMTGGEVLAPKLDAKYRSQGVRVFYSSDAYLKSDREIDAYLMEHGFPASRHAGVADTSELWAVNANYVRPDKIVVGGPVPSAGSPLALGAAGVEGDPRKSSQELGRMFMEWKVKNAVTEIRKLIQNSMAHRESSPPR